MGHAIRNNGLGCDLITGVEFGKRKRGRPKMRFVENVKDIAGIGIARIVRGRKIEKIGGDSVGVLFRSSERPNHKVMMYIQTKPYAFNPTLYQYLHGKPYAFNPTLYQ